MQIYIMRHGEAANISGEDSLRPLTKQGMLEADKMGLWLACNAPQLTNVYVSPYLRAQQTCANVTDALEKSALFNKVSTETLDFITPSGNASQVHDFIDGLFQGNDFIIENSVVPQKNGSGENQAILFVSHMPFVSYLVAELTDSPNTPIFSTGAIAIIDYDLKQMKGQLIALVTPTEVLS